MKRLIYKIVCHVHRMILKRKGWVLSDNVVVSIHGVKKIGKGNIYCGDNVNINAESMIISNANVYIGKNSTLAYRSIITTNANPNAPYNQLSKLYPPSYKEVWIGENVWIGAGAIILPGCKIGDNCVIAAGAVVTNDIPNNVMVAGVPAKIKKQIVL